MRIAYFGGSFDPPHRGHLAVARAAAEAFALDTVLFVPTGRQPLKPAGPVAAYADRLAMVELLCAPPVDAGANFPQLVASPMEAPGPGGQPNYTVDTLERLATTLQPPDALFVLVGADAFLQLPQWRSPERLLVLAEWIIVSRPGFDLGHLDRLPLTPEQRRRVHPLPALDDPTSATSLRQALASGSNHRELLKGLPPAVLRYIREHGLYELATAAPGFGPAPH